MRFKTTAWLFLGVCVLGAVIWLMEGRVGAPDEGSATARVLAVEAPEIERLVIATEAFQAVLVRERGVWQMQRPVPARANEERMARILAALESMRCHERITPAQRTSRELTLADYGFTTPAARVVVETALRRQTLLVGETAPLGQLLYVKLAASDDVLAASPGILDVLPSSADDLRDRSVFVGDPYAASRLEITWSGRGFTQLARVDGAWRIQQPFDAPADEAKVAGLLDRLYAARIHEFVWDAEHGADASLASESEAVNGTLESRAEAFGLLADDAVVRIGVWTGEGHAGRELLLGAPVPADEARGGGAVYARFGAGASIFTVSTTLRDAFSVGAPDLRDKDLFPFAAADVTHVHLRAGERTLALHRTAAGAWRITAPVHRPADEQRVEDFVRRAVRLRAQEFLGAPATNLSSVGLEPPRLTVRLGSFPEAVAAVEAGNEDAAKRAPMDHGLCLGATNARTGQVYARFEDEALAFTLDDERVGSWGAALTDPLHFRDRTILAVDPENVKRVTLAVGGREQTIVRSDDDQWSVGAGLAPSNAVNRDAVDQVLFHVSHLRADGIDHLDSEAPAAGTGDGGVAVLTLGLTGDEGIQKKLTMWARPEAEGVLATVQGQDVVFVLSTRVYRTLTADLLQSVAPAAGEGQDPGQGGP